MTKGDEAISREGERDCFAEFTLSGTEILRSAIQKLPSKTVIPGLTRNPGAFAWIPAFAGKTNGDSFLPGVFRRAESGTQNDKKRRARNDSRRVGEMKYNPPPYYFSVKFQSRCQQISDESHPASSERSYRVPVAGFWSSRSIESPAGLI
ncbi:MAG: hypothetical protein WC749_10160 [Dehalococcoidia bacterium]